MLRIQIYRNVYKNLMQVSVTNTLSINLFLKRPNWHGFFQRTRQTDINTRQLSQSLK